MTQLIQKFYDYKEEIIKYNNLHNVQNNKKNNDQRSRSLLTGLLKNKNGNYSPYKLCAIVGLTLLSGVSIKNYVSKNKFRIA